MKKINLLLTICFCMSLFTNAQDIVKQVEENDIVVLKLGEHTGNTQWQKSTDNSSWSDMGGETKDSLKLTVTEEAYYRASVTAGNCNPYISGVTRIMIQSATPDSIVDADGNWYPVKAYGNQLWITEHLRTTKYSNGDDIPTTDSSTILNTSASKYQWASDDNNSSLVKYGRLYTWWAATDDRNICPSGWKLPSLADYDELKATLIDLGYVGEYDEDGEGDDLGKAMASTYGWKTGGTDPGDVGKNPELNNASGFNASPAGYWYNGASTQKGKHAALWVTEGWNDYSGHVYYLKNISPEFSPNLLRFKHAGLSVRCMKGTSQNNHEVNVSIDQPNLDQCDDVTSVAKAHVEKIVEIYPNPISNVLTVQSSGTILPLRMYDMTGKMMLQIELNKTQTSIDVSHLDKGFYLLQIQEQNGMVSTRKIIKE